MQYAKFMRGKTLIDSEVKIETDWFTGRYDARLQVGDCQYVVDYKSGYKNRLYFEQKLQLIAYTMAVPAKMAIVPVPSFAFVEVEIENRKPYEEFLKALSLLWKLKKEIEARSHPFITLKLYRLRRSGRIVITPTPLRRLK
jgi:hypothetical protein